VSNAGVQLNKLRRIRNELDDLAREPAIRDRVTDAMKIYERDVLREVTWHP
jgi:hypothetical protein